MYPETPIQLSTVFTVSVSAWLDRDTASRLIAFEGDFVDPDRAATIHTPRASFAGFEVYEQAHITAGISSLPVCVLSLMLVNRTGYAQTLKEVHYTFNDVTRSWQRA